MKAAHHYIAKTNLDTQILNCDNLWPLKQRYQIGYPGTEEVIRYICALRGDSIRKNSCVNL